MAHAVFHPRALMSKDIDSLNRSAVAEIALDNGNLVVLGGRSAAAGEGEVFAAVAPSTANGLTGLWMVWNTEEIVVTESKWKGLDIDPRNFFTPAGDVFMCFKPQLGDIITITADGLAGTKGVNTFVVATDGSGVKPEWAATAGSGIFAMKLLETTYISIPDGALGSLGRVTAYTFEVVAL